jgi:putative ABC transport system permease protein
MKSYDLLELATRNLKESILRNSLTTIGIAVGVASLVSMLSLGVGLQQLATQRLEKVGFNLLTVTSRRGLRQGGPLMAAPNVDAESARALDEPARREIARLPNVVEAYPDIRFPADVHFDAATRRGAVAGVPASAKNTDDFDRIAGSFFSSADAPEALIERSFAAGLLGKAPVVRGRGRAAVASLPEAAELAKSLVGRQLPVHYAQRIAGTGADVSYSVAERTVPLKIVGVVDIDQQARMGGRAGVFVPLLFAESLHAFQGGDLRATEAPSYMALTVRVKNPSAVQAVEDAIRNLGFNSISILDAMRSLRQVFAVFDLFLGVFGSLALAVASIGIVNTLVMAILERRREIGIMKAIGASDTDVKRIFFAEAGAMGVFGGAAGVAFGWAIGRVINFGANIYMGRQGMPSIDIWFVPWWLVAGAIGFALVVSLAAGWYPASRASRLDPVEALRYQ